MFLNTKVHFSIVKQSSAFEKVLHAIYQSSDFTKAKVHFSIVNQLKTDDTRAQKLAN